MSQQGIAVSTAAVHEFTVPLIREYERWLERQCLPANSPSPKTMDSVTVSALRHASLATAVRVWQVDVSQTSFPRLCLVLRCGGSRPVRTYLSRLKRSTNHQL